MEQGQLDAAMRTGTEHSALRLLRESGQVPAVLYGGASTSMPISVSERVLHENLSASRKFVELAVNGQSIPAMIHDVQRDPVTKRVVHADFYRVDVNRETDVEVPIHLHGVDTAQRQGCIVQQQVRTITVRALPRDTPEYISIDVSSLTAGSHLAVSDIMLPTGVRLKSDPSEVLVTALAPSQVVVPEAIPSEPEKQDAGKA